MLIGGAIPEKYLMLSLRYEIWRFGLPGLQLRP
jgi:hypothetical protein